MADSSIQHSKWLQRLRTTEEDGEAIAKIIEARVIAELADTDPNSGSDDEGAALGGVAILITAAFMMFENVGGFDNPKAKAVYVDLFRDHAEEIETGAVAKAMARPH